MHKFESAGLGLAPFTFIGMTRRIGPIRLPNGLEVGSAGQAMGCCDYCGQGIADCYIIKSADDKQFEVGCDCVFKIYADTSKAELNRDPVYQAVKRAKLDGQRKARHTNEAVKIAEGSEFFNRDDVQAWLISQPHPFASLAARGLTRLDYFQYCLNCSGNSGKIKTFKQVRTLFDGCN